METKKKLTTNGHGNSFVDNFTFALRLANVNATIAVLNVGDNQCSVVIFVRMLWETSVLLKPANRDWYLCDCVVTLAGQTNGVANVDDLHYRR